MIGLKSIYKLIKVLQADDSPWQVALGVALGMTLGLQPINGPQSLLLFIFIFFINVNLGSVFLSAALFAIFGTLLDPLTHQLGLLLLVSVDGLTPLWTSLYNTPFIPFTSFNNTVVLGNFILSLILFIPVMLGSKHLITLYRKHWRDRVAQSKIVKWFQRTKIAVSFGAGQE